jgi:hypothetical protein
MSSRRRARGMEAQQALGRRTRDWAVHQKHLDRDTDSGWLLGKPLRRPIVPRSVAYGWGLGKQRSLDQSVEQQPAVPRSAEGRRRAGGVA